VRIVSVNVGMPREVAWRGRTVRTGIFKSPVRGRVAVRHHHLAGDGQADLEAHGGAAKAVYAYPQEHYPFWRDLWPEPSWEPGTLGENLTTQGLLEDAVHLGDRLRVGTAVVEVTQPRVPCFKLGIRLGRPEAVKRFLAEDRPGFYLAVVEEGHVEAGDAVERLEVDPRRVRVTDALRIYRGEVHDPELLQRAMDVPSVPEGWRRRFERALGRET
jgi:MOSC domain-containing protein YiiM